MAVLGIVIGIMAVVVMVAVGETVQQSITDQFSSLGTNTIMIRAGAAQSAGVRSGCVRYCIRNRIRYRNLRRK